MENKFYKKAIKTKLCWKSADEKEIVELFFISGFIVIAVIYIFYYSKRKLFKKLEKKDLNSVSKELLSA
jgi:hypothetical protein